jgi:hypothetical protein
VPWNHQTVASRDVTTKDSRPRNRVLGFRIRDSGQCYSRLVPVQFSASFRLLTLLLGSHAAAGKWMLLIPREIPALVLRSLHDAGEWVLGRCPFVAESLIET